MGVVSDSWVTTFMIQTLLLAIIRLNQQPDYPNAIFVLYAYFYCLHSLCIG